MSNKAKELEADFIEYKPITNIELWHDLTTPTYWLQLIWQTRRRF